MTSCAVSLTGNAVSMTGSLGLSDVACAQVAEAMRPVGSLSGISSPLLQRLLSAAASHEVRPALSGLQPHAYACGSETARAWAGPGTQQCQQSRRLRRDLRA